MRIRDLARSLVIVGDFRIRQLALVRTLLLARQRLLTSSLLRFQLFLYGVGVLRFLQRGFIARPDASFVLRLQPSAGAYPKGNWRFFTGGYCNFGLYNWNLWLCNPLLRYVSLPRRQRVLGPLDLDRIPRRLGRFQRLDLRR